MKESTRENEHESKSLGMHSHGQWIDNRFYGWWVNDQSHSDWSYNDQPYIDEPMSEQYSDGEEYEDEVFDESVLTPEQKVQLDALQEESPELSRKTLAAMMRINLLLKRMALGGKEITSNEIREAHALKTVMDFTPPTQLEGTSTPSPCIEKVASCNLLLIDECMESACESQDEVDYSLVNSTNLEIDFIFSSNAFTHPSHSNINEHLRKYISFVMTCFNIHLVMLSWTIMFLLAKIVYCENRRRTKGHLAQPFDSCD